MLRTHILIALMFLTASCSPVVQDFKKANGSPELKDNLLHIGNDTTLPVRLWLPEIKQEDNNNPESEAKTELAAIVIALHGFNDYSNAFENTGKYLSKRNIGVIAYDQRGFGKTGQHGIWAGENNLVQDAQQMIHAVKNKFPDIPVYMLGESMGGAVVIATLANNSTEQIDGVILSAPAVWGDKSMNSLYRATLWLMAHTLPHRYLTGQGLKIIPSDNIKMLKKMGRDPLVIKKTRIDAIYGIMGLMDTAYSKIHTVNLPTLLLYGDKDQVIPESPISDIEAKLPKIHKKALYPNGYHMLLRDLAADIVLNDIVSWVKTPERALPSGYDKNWLNDERILEKSPDRDSKKSVTANVE